MRIPRHRSHAFTDFETLPEFSGGSGGDGPVLGARRWGLFLLLFILDIISRELRERDWQLELVAALSDITALSEIASNQRRMDGPEMTTGRRSRQSNTANHLLGMAGERPALRGFGVAVKRLLIFGSDWCLRLSMAISHAGPLLNPG